MKDYLQRILRDKGDEEAWEALYLDNRALLSAVAGKYIFNLNDRQDVQQEIFIKLYKNIHSYDPTHNFQAWLYTLSKSVCFDWIKRSGGYGRTIGKKNQEIIRIILYDDAFGGDQPDTVDFTDTVIIRDALKKALSTIEDREQVLAFWLQYVEDLSLNEISEILHKPASTIHNWPTRVRDKIRPILAELLEKKTSFAKYK